MAKSFVVAIDESALPASTFIFYVGGFKMIVKTIKGYISILKRIEKIILTDLKNYDKLSEKQKEIIRFLSGEISNFLGEFKKNSLKYRRTI